MKATVLGCGSWGTALSVLLGRNGVSVHLWGRDSDEISTLCRERKNPFYLPDVALPSEVVPSTHVPSYADFWVVAVPSKAVRQVADLLPHEYCRVLVASKGLEPETAKRMSEVIREERSRADICVMSGPNLAVEVAQGIPTATVLASRDLELASWMREHLLSRSFRVYTNPDIVGVELGGALKNVLAIGAGMSDGLGFGDNTKGALLSRGLREMSEIGVELGAELATFLGLSGVGDLFATAASRLSRNYRVGFLLGKGLRLSDALNEVGQVAEGIATSNCVMILAREARVETPVMTTIHSVVQGRTKPIDAVGELMDRAPKVEI
jgi:glycerol-3-phosphate dehydrogenase (NAD(P)+)